MQTPPDDVRLHVVTIGTEPPESIAIPAVDSCCGDMTCECLRCQADKAALVRRGVRKRTPVPLKHAA